jgi:hypothetical protein
MPWARLSNLLAPRRARVSVGVGPKLGSTEIGLDDHWTIRKMKLRAVVLYQHRTVEASGTVTPSRVE